MVAPLEVVRVEGFAAAAFAPNSIHWATVPPGKTARALIT
jgi:hypothetical protein